MNNDEVSAFNAFQKIIDEANRLDQLILLINKLKRQKDSNMSDSDDDIQTEFFCDFWITIWHSKVMECKIQLSPGFSNQLTVCFESNKAYETAVLWDELSNEGCCDYAYIHEDGSFTLGRTYTPPSDSGRSYQEFVELLWVLAMNGFEPMAAVTKEQGNCKEFHERLKNYMDDIAKIKCSSELDLSALFGFIF